MDASRDRLVRAPLMRTTWAPAPSGIQYRSTIGEVAASGRSVILIGFEGYGRIVVALLGSGAVLLGESQRCFRVAH